MSKHDMLSQSALKQLLLPDKHHLLLTDFAIRFLGDMILLNRKH